MKNCRDLTGHIEKKIPSKNDLSNFLTAIHESAHVWFAYKHGIKISLVRVKYILKTNGNITSWEFGRYCPVIGQKAPNWVIAKINIAGYLSQIRFKENIDPFVVAGNDFKYMINYCAKGGDCKEIVIHTNNEIDQEINKIEMFAKTLLKAKNKEMQMFEIESEIKRIKEKQGD